jgi:hypothetical protein
MKNKELNLGEKEKAIGVTVKLRIPRFLTTPGEIRASKTVTKTGLMPSLSPRERARVRGNASLNNQQCTSILQTNNSDCGLRPSFGFRISAFGFPL